MVKFQHDLPRRHFKQALIVWRWYKVLVSISFWGFREILKSTWSCNFESYWSSTTYFPQYDHIYFNWFYYYIACTERRSCVKIINATLFCHTWQVVISPWLISSLWKPMERNLPQSHFQWTGTSHPPAGSHPLDRDGVSRQSLFVLSCVQHPVFALAPRQLLPVQFSEDAPIKP